MLYREDEEQRRRTAQPAPTSSQGLCSAAPIDAESLFSAAGVTFDGMTDDSAALNRALREARRLGLHSVDCRGRTVKVVAGPILHPGELVLRNLHIDYGEVRANRGRYYGLGAHGRMSAKVPLALDARYQGHDLIVSAKDAMFEPGTGTLTIGGISFAPLDYVKVGTSPPVLNVGQIDETAMFIPLDPAAEVERMRPFGILQVQETQERIAYVAKQTRPDRCGVVVRTLGGVSGRGHMGTRPTRCQAGATAVEYDTGRFHLGHNRAYRKAEWGQITQISPCGSDYYRITLSTSLVERAGYAVSQAAWLAKLDPRHAVMNCDVDGVVLIGSRGHRTLIDSQGHRTPTRIREVGAYFTFVEGREHRIESRRSGWRSLEYQDCLHIKVIAWADGKSEVQHSSEHFYIGISLWNACQWMSVDLSRVKDTFASVVLLPIHTRRQLDYSGQPTHIQIIGGQFVNSSSVHDDAHHAWQIDGGARHVTYIGCSATDAAAGITFRGADSVSFIGGRLTNMINRGVGIVDSHTLFDIRIQADVGPRSHRGGTTALSEALEGGTRIVAITQARPAVVTIDDGTALREGDTIAIGGIAGLERLYTVHNLSGRSFELYTAPGALRTAPRTIFRGRPAPVETRDMPEYQGGGLLNAARIGVTEAAGLIDVPDRRVGALMARLGEEIICYEAVSGDGRSLLGVRRGQQGTAIRAHPAGTSVIPFGRRGYEVFNIDLRGCKLYRQSADAPITMIRHPNDALSAVISLADGSVFGVPDGTMLTLEIEGEDPRRDFESEIVVGRLVGNDLVGASRGQLGTTPTAHSEGAFVLRYAPAVSNVEIDISGEMDHDSVAGRIRGFTPAHQMNVRARLRHVGERPVTSAAVQAQPHLLTLRGEWDGFLAGIDVLGRKQLVTDFRARIFPPSPEGQAIRVLGDECRVIGGLAEGYTTIGVRVMSIAHDCYVGGGFAAPDAAQSVNAFAVTGDTYSAVSRRPVQDHHLSTVPERQEPANPEAAAPGQSTEGPAEPKQLPRA